MPGGIIGWPCGHSKGAANLLPETSSIYWRWIILRFQMDGVPGISPPGIEPGETSVYRFAVCQASSYRYHGHTGFRKQTGLYGPIVVEPRDGDPPAQDRAPVVPLLDWTDEEPAAVYGKLNHYCNWCGGVEDCPMRHRTRSIAIALNREGHEELGR